MTATRTMTGMVVGLMVWVGVLQASWAAEEVVPPSADLVKRLIALEEEIRPETISVGLILAGEIRCEGAFTCKDAVRVLVILPVNGEGGRVRRVQEKILLWSERWGWFAYREITVRGAETIRVFSETEGLVDVR